MKTTDKKYLKTEELKEALLDVAARAGGSLFPEDVVRAARDPESPLHGFFEWDDSAAAEAWRIVQAQGLIRRVKVKVEQVRGAPVVVRAFVNVAREDAGEDMDGGVVVDGRRGPAPGQYVPVADAMARVDWRDEMMARARRDMVAFKSKYAALGKVAKVIAAMDDAMEGGAK